AATLPCGVRTFLPPRSAASGCSTSSGARRAPALLTRWPLPPPAARTASAGSSGTGSTARSAGSGCTAAAARACGIPGRYHPAPRPPRPHRAARRSSRSGGGAPPPPRPRAPRDPPAPREDHLVAAAQLTVDGADELAAPLAIALDLGPEPSDRVAQL